MSPLARHPLLVRTRSLQSLSFLRPSSGDKAWLETHIWMAKRMHMVNTWGFRIVRPTSLTSSLLSRLELTRLFAPYLQAHRPTEKAFRPSHRAAMHGSILNDVSYFSLIELKGEEHALERVLRRVAGEVCWGKRYVSLLVDGLECLTD